MDSRLLDLLVTGTVMLLTAVGIADAGTGGPKGSAWGYEGSLGPDQWYQVFPVCAQSHQSPINIDTDKVIFDPNLMQLELSGYSHVQDTKMTLENNGHTVKVQLDGRHMRVSGGGLQGTYLAHQFHFHWGAEDRRGSEHEIDGHHFPMEMHIVHYDSRYPNISEAMDKSDGLMVLGFLFEVGSHNDDFDQLLAHFDQIGHKNDHVEIESFPLRSLMADNLREYYRYHGSLTTPPCFETVIWTLFKETIKVSEDQLEIFRNRVYRNYANQTEVELSDDFRPIQPLLDRKVFFHGSIANSAYHHVAVFGICAYVLIAIAWTTATL